MKKIAILGAGLTGLTAAYYLTQQGHEVSVFEKESISGGLASGFKEKGWGWPLERFYHHLFANDWEAIDLVKELGLESKLFFKKPITAIYYDESRIKNQESRMQLKTQGYQITDVSLIPNSQFLIPIYPLDSPLALLKFPHLNLVEKLRVGVTLAYLKTLANYKSLQQTTAERWLKKTMGERPFKILWEPLLISKFGKFAPKISAAWFWARIKKRTQSLGYLEGGFQTLADRLVEKIRQKGGQVLLNKEVRKIEKVNTNYKILNTNYDIVISTLPTPIFLKIAPPLPKDYQKRLSQIPHLWAQTLILEMNKPFLSDTYWLNINETSFPFLAVVEHTNFIDRSHYSGRHLLYIGNYLPDNHPYLQKSSKELLEIFKPHLLKINPSFNFQFSIFNFQLFTTPNAQPVITVCYRPPDLETPIPGLYLANLDCVYPWDRGTNYAIELGEKVAKRLSVISH